MRKKPNLIPRLEKVAALMEKEPETNLGIWRERYPGYEGLYAELGCGKGKFSAETAAGEPQNLFVAVERVREAIVVAMERCFAAELKNIRFMDVDAARLGEYFAPGELDGIYINFCDPWPGKRHAKRRLTSPGFLALYREALKPGGEIRFKTDNSDLFEYSVEQFAECGFETVEITRDLHANGPVGVMTDYEEKFFGQGVAIKRCVVRKPE